ncbi:MAG: hypothetical protein M1831_005048 [Alyxoria varia]|nr:MAG: hypothetical protein M1831_005048 [Alyxoria varia]
MYAWIAIPTVIVSALLGKLSIAAFLLAIQGKTQFKRRIGLVVIVTSCAILEIPNFFLTFFQCNPVSALWDPETAPKYSSNMMSGSTPTCPRAAAINVFQFAYGIWNIVTDVSVAIFPIIMLWNVRLPISIKIGICVLTVLGVAASGSAAAMKTQQVRKIVSEESDPTFALADLVVTTFWEVWILLIVTAIPPLWPLVRTLSGVAVPKTFSASDAERTWHGAATSKRPDMRKSLNTKFMAKHGLNTDPSSAGSQTLLLSHKKSASLDHFQCAGYKGEKETCHKRKKSSGSFHSEGLGQASSLSRQISHPLPQNAQGVPLRSLRPAYHDSPASDDTIAVMQDDSVLEDSTVQKDRMDAALSVPLNQQRVDSSLMVGVGQGSPFIAPPPTSSSKVRSGIEDFFPMPRSYQANDAPDFPWALIPPMPQPPFSKNEFPGMISETSDASTARRPSATGHNTGGKRQSLSPSTTASPQPSAQPPAPAPTTPLPSLPQPGSRRSSAADENSRGRTTEERNTGYWIGARYEPNPQFGSPIMPATANPHRRSGSAGPSITPFTATRRAPSPPSGTGSNNPHRRSGSAGPSITPFTATRRAPSPPGRSVNRSSSANVAEDRTRDVESSPDPSTVGKVQTPAKGWAPKLEKIGPYAEKHGAEASTNTAVSVSLKSGAPQLVTGVRKTGDTVVGAPIGGWIGPRPRAHSQGESTRSRSRGNSMDGDSITSRSNSRSNSRSRAPTRKTFEQSRAPSTKSTGSRHGKRKTDDETSNRSRTNSVDHTPRSRNASVERKNNTGVTGYRTPNTSAANTPIDGVSSAATFSSNVPPLPINTDFSKHKKGDASTATSTASSPVTPAIGSRTPPPNYATPPFSHNKSTPTTPSSAFPGFGMSTPIPPIPPIPQIPGYGGTPLLPHATEPSASALTNAARKSPNPASRASPTAEMEKTPEPSTRGSLDLLVQEVAMTPTALRPRTPKQQQESPDWEQHSHQSLHAPESDAISLKRSSSCYEGGNGDRVAGGWI